MHLAPPKVRLGPKISVLLETEKQKIMNSGQTIMAIGALMLLLKLILSGNEMMSSSGDVVQVGQAMIEATTIGQSTIERDLSSQL